MSYLTQSQDSLWSDVFAGLEGEGFAFNPLTTSLPAYLATALGEVDAYKTKSVAQMLAELNSEFGGEAVSHLTTSVAELISTLDATLEAGEGGGGDWWPENAKVYIDFLNDRAWTIEDGQVAINTLLGNDPLADGAYATSYDPADLTEDGFEGSDPFAFLGTAKTRLLAGATFRIQIVHPSGQSTVLLNFGTENGSVSVEVDIGPSDSLEVIGAEIFETVPDVFTADAMNCMAVSMAAARIEVAVNGVLRVDEILAEEDWPTGGDLIDFALSVPGGNVPVESITIYDLLPSTSGLAALSAVI